VRRSVKVALAKCGGFDVHWLDSPTIRTFVYADPLLDSPFAGALLVKIQVTTMPSVEYVGVGLKKIGHVVDLAPSTCAVVIEFNIVV
jgi:hypothetical protein